MLITATANQIRASLFRGVPASSPKYLQLSVIDDFALVFTYFVYGQNIKQNETCTYFNTTLVVTMRSSHTCRILRTKRTSTVDRHM